MINGTDRDLDRIFASWSVGPNQEEENRILNAVTQIKSAVVSDPILCLKNINVFVQGSYKNRVNVKKDSDVDIGVICNEMYFTDYPDSHTQTIVESAAIPAAYTYFQFKNDLENALVRKFGRGNVKRGNKSFDIRETTYRVEADVVAFAEHRRYDRNLTFLSGVQMFPDDGMPHKIVNWPDQHYRNGEYKNNLTERAYKRTVRILKSLANEMEKTGYIGTGQMPGFLIECLAWNVPNDLFAGPGYSEIIKNVITYLYSSTNNEYECREWGEVSGLKYLFGDHQPWTIEQVVNFTLSVYNYVGFRL